jgi:hypothetical protein
LGRSGQRLELSQATGMALVRCILGKFLGVVCHCFPPFFHLLKRDSIYCIGCSSRKTYELVQRCGADGAGEPADSHVREAVGRRWPNARSRTLFVLHQNLFATSVRSIALRLAAFFLSTYLCEDAVSQMKIFRSRYRRRLTDQHLCLPLCLGNYEPSFSNLLQDMQCHAVGRLMKKMF